MKIGVFDSGIGGLSVARAIEAALPQHDVLFLNDQAHMPYGSRTPAEILPLMRPIIDNLITAGCQLIVIACNTVSTTLIKDLRAHYALPFVAMEPMVKPAATLTKTGVIAICATPGTLASQRYHWLKQTYAADVKVIEPDCSNWAYMIEREQVNHAIISGQIEEVLAEKADVIVLGCTHYHWIEQDIKQIVQYRASVLQPEQAIVRQVTRVIQRLQHPSS